MKITVVHLGEHGESELARWRSIQRGHAFACQSLPISSLRSSPSLSPASGHERGSPCSSMVRSSSASSPSGDVVRAAGCRSARGSTTVSAWCTCRIRTGIRRSCCVLAAAGRMGVRPPRRRAEAFRAVPECPGFSADHGAFRPGSSLSSRGCTTSPDWAAYRASRASWLGWVSSGSSSTHVITKC